ncbi:MAG: glycosyltransferase [Breznakibacter sp.]
MSKISVIIPTFNRKHLIDSTINNLLNQSIQPYEIIVVDDHSTDGTIEYLEATFGNTISVIVNTGKGPGSARNTGFKHSSGEFIQFFDSDDLMTKNKLEIQYNLLKNNVSRKIVYGPYLPAKFEDGHWIATDVVMQYYPLPNKPLSYLIVQGWCAITQSCLFTRELIEEIGPWREDLMPHEDKEYWYRLGKYAPNPIHENQTCVIYRQHQQQITDLHVNSISRTKDGLNAFYIIEECAKKDRVPKYYLLRLKGLIASYKYFLCKFSSSPELKHSDYLYILFERILSKIGRIKTGTNWQKMYGPLNNSTIIQYFLNNL